MIVTVLDSTEYGRKRKESNSKMDPVHFEKSVSIGMRMEPRGARGQDYGKASDEENQPAVNCGQVYQHSCKDAIRGINPRRSPDKTALDRLHVDGN